MREGRPSLTASLVAALRGAGDAAVDPVARDLVPAAAAVALRAIAPLPASLIAMATLGFSDHVALRTRAIDDALRDALASPRPPRQLVVLGAGLDARAYRLEELREVVVFEVDHPSSQVAKQGRLAGRPALAREVRFLGVDFERASLDDALAGGGHRDDVPTFWIWEGVTMYLHVAAIRATLDVLGRRSALASRALVTYATPDMTPLGGVVGLAALGLFRAIGEPLHGLLATRQVHLELEAVAYHVLRDEGMRAVAARYGNPRGAMLVADERLVLAERR